MGRAERLTREIQVLDRELFCRKNEELGRYEIYRHAKRYRTVHLDENTALSYSMDFPQLIICLTDNWSASGKPVDWGILPVVKRLQEIDAWNRAEYLKELETQEEKKKEAGMREFRNETEAFLKEFRPQFSRAFNDVNTANMKKIDKRRIKDGNL